MLSPARERQGTRFSGNSEAAFYGITKLPGQSFNQPIPFCHLQITVFHTGLEEG